MDFENLEKKIGIKFKNQNLLKQAMVHRSYLNENPKFNLDNNERLEFLGDAVLELIVSEELYKKLNLKEGELTKIRSALVNTKVLAKTAKKLEIPRFLYLSKGEKKTKGEHKQRILANAFEALIGAIYLDQGIDQTKKFIKKEIFKKLPQILKYKLYKDPKSLFQEIIQYKTKITPHYKVLKEEGPDHKKIFTVGVYVKDKLYAKAKGKNKQEAEIKAAKKALLKINK